MFSDQQQRTRCEDSDICYLDPLTLALEQQRDAIVVDEVEAVREPVQREAQATSEE